MLSSIFCYPINISLTIRYEVLDLPARPAARPRAACDTKLGYSENAYLERSVVTKLCARFDA